MNIEILGTFVIIPKEETVLVKKKNIYIKDGKNLLDQKILRWFI